MRWREWSFRQWMSREEAQQHDGMMACRVKSRCDANPSYACTHPFEPFTLPAHPLGHPENASWRPVLPPGCFLTFLTCSTSNGEGGSRRNSQRALDRRSATATRCSTDATLIAALRQVVSSLISVRCHYQSCLCLLRASLPQRLYILCKCFVLDDR